MSPDSRSYRRRCCRFNQGEGWDWRRCRPPELPHARLRGAKPSPPAMREQRSIMGRRQCWVKEVSASMCGWRRSRLWDPLMSPRAKARPRRCVFALAGTACPRAGVIQVESIMVLRRQGAGGRRWHNPPSLSSRGRGKDSGETQALMNKNGLGKGAAAWQRLCSAHRAWSGHVLQAGEPRWPRGRDMGTRDPPCETTRSSYVPCHWVLQAQGT